MSKAAYLIWKNQHVTIDDLKHELFSNFCSQFKNHFSSLQFNFFDEDVRSGTGLIQSNREDLPDAFIFLKSISFFDQQCDIEEYLDVHVFEFEGYLLNERKVLSDKHKSLGDRSNGFSQIALIDKAEGISESNFFSHWKNVHTQIAIDTQSTFEYTQNTIEKGLNTNSKQFLAIVEESFPIEALDDQEIFYDSKDNPDQLKMNQDLMMNSCMEFINFNNIDVIPTSQYIMV